MFAIIVSPLNNYSEYVIISYIMNENKNKIKAAKTQWKALQLIKNMEISASKKLNLSENPIKNVTKIFLKNFWIKTQ